MTTETEERPEVTKAIRVFEAMDDRAIVRRIEGQATGAWAYRFQTGGQWVEGISVDGVQEIVRRLAGGGEVIRELTCELESEDEKEGRFLAKAGRFLIREVGGKMQEVLLDTAIRGKRQSKTMRRRDGSITEDEHWYEKGVSKANRNAAEALIPELAKAQILEDARGSGRMQQAPQRQPQGGAQGPRPAPAANAPRQENGAPQPAPRAEALALFNEAQKDWDRPSFQRLLRDIYAKWPQMFNGDIAVLNKLPLELVPEFVAYLRAQLRPEPNAEDEPVEGEYRVADDAPPVDPDDLPFD